MLYNFDRAIFSCFSPSMSTGESEEEVSEEVDNSIHRSSDSVERSRDSVDGRNRDRSSSLRPALFHQPTGQPVEAVNQLAKSVSTPHIAENGTSQTSTEEYSTSSSKSP